MSSHQVDILSLKSQAFKNTKVVLRAASPPIDVAQLDLACLIQCVDFPDGKASPAPISYHL